MLSCIIIKVFLRVDDDVVKYCATLMILEATFEGGGGVV